MTDNIFAHEHPESERARGGGFTLWFTGLSGSGKTTIAHLVGPALDERGHVVEYLDGDTIRTHLSKGLGFSKEDRDTNIERIGWVASRIVRHGGTAITAAISPYVETRPAGAIHRVEATTTMATGSSEPAGGAWQAEYVVNGEKLFITNVVPGRTIGLVCLIDDRPAVEVDPAGPLVQALWSAHQIAGRGSPRLGGVPGSTDGTVCLSTGLLRWCPCSSTVAPCGGSPMRSWSPLGWPKLW